MPVLLGLLLFSVLLTPSGSLECETCTGKGLNCPGTMVNCSANGDSCAVTVLEIIVGNITIQEIMKGCLSTHICGLESFSLNAGKLFNTRGRTVCCKGDDCVSVSPKVPPINSKVNGKKCPACFTQSSSCTTEEVECTGDEDHCLDTSFESDTTGISVKGCTTKSYCEALKETIAMTFNVTTFVALRGQCERANEAPPSSRFPLLALFGLLAAKIIF